MPKTQVKTEIGVKAWTTTTNFTVNKVLNLFFKYIDNRGLSTEKFIRIRDTLDRGLWVWLTSGDLKKAYLEIWNPDTGKAVERLDLDFDIADPDSADIDYQELEKDQFKSYAEELNKLARKLDGLKESCKYRVLVKLDPDHPQVDGWKKTKLRDISHLKKFRKGKAIKTGLINSVFRIWTKGG